MTYWISHTNLFKREHENKQLIRVMVTQVCTPAFSFSPNKRHGRKLSSRTDDQEPYCALLINTLSPIQTLDTCLKTGWAKDTRKYHESQEIEQIF